MQQDFSARLSKVMKALAVSRGQLAAALAVDKSIVSRWLSGAAAPSEYNLARLTAWIGTSLPGFTMFDWEADDGAFAARIGLVASASPETGGAGPDWPGLQLPAIGPCRHETAARGPRYCGLWESIMPTVGRPDAFHREHTLIRQQGTWLVGEAFGVTYRWVLTAFVANGQLILWMSDSDDFVFRQFNRADGPLVDQVDGLMLAAASLPHQAPTACRVLMTRLLPPEADADTIARTLDERAAERRFMARDELPDGLFAALLPDSGPASVPAGGDRLLRADPTMSLVRSRWF